MDRNAKREARLRGSGARSISQPIFSISNVPVVQPEQFEFDDFDEAQSPPRSESPSQSNPPSLQSPPLSPSSLHGQRETRIQRYKISTDNAVSFIPNEDILIISYPKLLNGKRAMVRATQQRVKLLDVIRFFIESFNPDLTQDQELINNQYKTICLVYIDQLRDLANNVEDIAKQIYYLQKKKHVIRKDILQLRQSHTEVGNELNQLRQNLKVHKKTHDDINLIHDQLINTKEEIQFFEPSTPKLSSKVKLQLNSLKGLINPRIGFVPKLTKLNKKLNTLNEKLE